MKRETEKLIIFTQTEDQAKLTTPSLSNTWYIAIFHKSAQLPNADIDQSKKRAC